VIPGIGNVLSFGFALYNGYQLGETMARCGL
jgi:hypothetical protein